MGSSSMRAAYERRSAPDTRTRLVLAGVGVFAAGAVALLAGIVLVTTDVAPAGWDVYAVRRAAGTLAALGVPALFLGTMLALPVSTGERLRVGAGAGLQFLGAMLFWRVYPVRWIGATPEHLTFEVTVVYTVGTLVALWFLLTSVAKLKTRNNPRGTVTVRVTKGGETRTVEMDPDDVEGRESLEEAVERAEFDS
jgi:hypothetical protein